MLRDMCLGVVVFLVLAPWMVVLDFALDWLNKKLDEGFPP